ncbi:MAG: type IX secretion system membrane protein PorP/SprF [Bacteroidetes bacterium]|nr:type IX secretion system membrane protein PorP/SprF [Bacteroidota bacterium]
MKKIFSALLLITMAGYQLLAQQEAQFTHYMFNNMAINPAFAGSNEAICFTGIARQQWYGMKDPKGYDVSPRTFLVSMDAPVLILHGGLGATVFQDQLGYERNVGLRLNYAYRFNLGSGILSFGLQAGFLNKTIDFSKFIFIDENDPLLSTSKESNFTTDFGFGSYYKVPGKFFLGLSAIQLTGAKQAIGKADLTLKRHYFLTGGYEYPLPDYPEFEIDPSFLVKSDGAATQYDLNTIVRYNNKFWGGVTYRVQDAIAIMLGMNIKNFRVGYSYDITTSKLTQSGSMGSHEIMVGYCFKIIIEKPRKSYRNTRFL